MENTLTSLSILPLEHIKSNIKQSCAIIIGVKELDMIIMKTNINAITNPTLRKKIEEMLNL